MKKGLTNNNQRVGRIFLAFVLTLVSVSLSQIAIAQAYTVRSYEMTVSGTSNVHDWTMKALNAKCNATFVIKTASPAVITGVSALDFSMPVKGLKSEHDLMDSRTYSTLKADKYPNITFKLSSATVTPQGGNKYVIQAKGGLTFAGVTREVVLNTTGVMNADKSITVTGKEKIKLSDWQIKAPSFMFGAMKVGNEVTVNFNLRFNQ
jgi:polyisoprenoid-binding protein YceI